MNATSLLRPLLFGAGFGLAFLLGRNSTLGSSGLASSGLGSSVFGSSVFGGGELAAQGRQPNNPPPPMTTPAPTDPRNAQPPLVYSEESGGSSAAANGFLAVTGSYGVGTSVLYVIDTVNRQLAVYEGRGGGPDQRRLVMVGARRIDLDLQLHSYNDRSEYEYNALQRLFERRDKKGASATPDDVPELPSRK